VPNYFVMLAYSDPGMNRLAVVLLGGGVIVALNQTLFNYITATLMPPQIRTTGIALGYGIAVAVFGGTASYILVWSQSAGGTWMFALYGAIIASLSIVFYSAARRKGYVYTESDAPDNAAAEDAVASPATV
jgi:MFS transporter, MHS family, alpha-ketoglutarate permease